MADSAIGAAQPAAREDQRTDAPATGTTTAPTAEREALVEHELLVEDVSIDGMCGVY